MPKIKELLTDESKWTKGAYARTENVIGENGCSWNDPEAVCWCIQGAVHHCYPLMEGVDICKKIAAAIYPDRPHWLAGIPQWNDRTTFDKVKALIEELDI